MDRRQGNPVLRRKLGAGAPAAPASAGGARHLARALARATSRIPGIVGSCAEPTRRTATTPELLELIESEAFVALIADPAGALGLAVLDPVATLTLIEALTVGRLAGRPPPARRATQIDAQLLSDVIDAALAEYDGQAGAEPAHRGGFRFQRFQADYRLLELLLEASRFDLILQPLALLGEDVRRDGWFLLALPQAGDAEGATAAPTPGCRAPRPARSDGWAQALEAQVMSAPARLTAVIGRVTMPISGVMGLGVGSRIALPLGNLEEVEVAALDGQVLGRGRLGQFRAMRAVRLTRLGPAAAVAQGVEDYAPAAPAPAVQIPGDGASGPEEAPSDPSAVPDG